MQWTWPCCIKPHPPEYFMECSKYTVYILKEAYSCSHCQTVKVLAFSSDGFSLGAKLQLMATLLMARTYTWKWGRWEAYSCWHPRKITAPETCVNYFVCLFKKGGAETGQNFLLHSKCFSSKQTMNVCFLFIWFVFNY